MKSIVRLVSVMLFLTMLIGVVGGSSAQNYPSKPIRLIVGYPPGGSTDITARTIGQRLSEALGQSIVIENKPGAGSNIGAELAAKADPDGYTLHMCTIANSINYSLYGDLPFDLVKSFTPVTQATSITSFLVVHPTLQVDSVKDLIKLAKSKKGELHYASSGVGNSPHLAAEMFKMMAGVNLVHVPYKGTGPELNDLLAGRVKIAFETTPAILPHVRAGKLKALAVNSAKRTPLLPDIPTMSESGLPGYEVTSWNGIQAPAGTSKEIIERLNSEIVKVLQMPDVKERLSSLGADPVGSTPEQFSAFIQAEIKKWAKVIKDGNVKID